ncbi:MAG: S-layer homology domain-containing protein [Bacillota bacterium]
MSGKKLTEVWGSNAINIVVTAADDLADNRDYADNFTDAAFIPHWSGDQVGAAAKAGYMGGYPDGSFKPQNPITRAEALVALNRVIQEGI